MTRPKNPNLTPKQEAVLTAIKNYESENQSTPSIREISKILNIKSPNTIFAHLKALQEKGYITKNLKGKLKNLSNNLIPLFGQIPAGFQAPAYDEGKELINLDKFMIKNPQNTFALKVKGNSMEKAGIMQGDLILVERKPTAKNNDIIVARLPDGFTVKRYIIQNGKPYLKAESNEKYEIQLVEGSEIWGVVTGTLRRY